MKIKGVKRTLVFNMFSGHCAYCGKKITLSNFETDHIFSSVEYQSLQFANAEIFNPGTGELITSYNHLANLFPSCVSCNRIKKEDSLSVFRYHLSSYRDNIFVKNKMLRTLNALGLIVVMSKPVIFFYEKVLSNSH